MSFPDRSGPFCARALTVVAVAAITGKFRFGPDSGRVILKTTRAGLAALAGHDLALEVTRWSARVEVPDEDAGGVTAATVTADLAVVLLRQRRLGQAAADEVPDVRDGRRPRGERLRQHHDGHHLDAVADHVGRLVHRHPPVPDHAESPRCRRHRGMQRGYVEKRSVDEAER